jgi:hypothetical protein
MLFVFTSIAIVTGLLTALLIHWITWYLRLHQLTLTVIAGAIAALGLTGFFFLFRDSDIAREVFIAMVILDLIALGMGILQSFALRISWWKGVLAVFLEMGLAFTAGAAVNLTLQKTILWFGEHFPGVDVYAVINTFLWTMIVALLLLAIARPLLLIKRPERS